MWRLVFWGLIFALISTPGVKAQRFHIRNFTAEDGFPAAQIFALHQDGKGYLWAGSPAGLSRYDGVGFTTFTQSEGLENQSIKVILSDPQGRLWFGTNEGVTVFDGRHFTHYGAASGIGAGRISSGLIDRHGTVWFATQEGGLSAFVAGRFHTYTRQDGLPDNNIYRVFADSRDRLWIGTRNAGIVVATLEPEGRLRDIRRYTMADGLPHDTIRAFAEDSGGNIYIGTRGGGIARYDGRSFSTYDDRHGLSSNDVLTLLVNRQGELVIGTYDRGITICGLPAMSGCRQFTKANGLQEDSVLSLLEDREGNLWIGLNYGISLLVTEKFASFTEQEGLVNNSVYAVYPDRDGSIWFGTFRGVSRLRFDPRTGVPRWTHLRKENDLPSAEVWDILRDRGGRLWIGTSSGLCLYSELTGCRVFTSRDGLVDNYILDLHEDAVGNLWLGTAGGVSMVTAASLGTRPHFKNYTQAAGLPANNIYAITEDRQGRLWFGTQAEGLAVLEGGKFRVYGKADGLRSDGIAALYATRDGSVWVGTRGGGLARYREPSANGKAFLSFGSAGGILADTVQAIREDPVGRLWLGTNRGVYLIDPARADREDAATLVLRHFEIKDGLADNDSSTTNSIALDAAGDFWFGFYRGVTRYRPALDRPDPEPPPVDIVRVAVLRGPQLRGEFSVADLAGQLIWVNDPLPPLSHDRNNIRFDFRSPAFTTRQQASYQVRLVGYDREWSAASLQPFKEYTNLDPGEYLFEVRARDGEATGSSAPARFRFSVLPAWWATTWFRLLLLILLAAVLLAAHRLRTAAYRRRTVRLEVLVAERTREIKSHVDELELANQLIEHHSRDLEDANERIREADRVKDSFLASMSHELRTPLNSIIGFSEVLLRHSGSALAEKQLRFLENIHGSGKHLLGLINNILDLSKIEAGKMELHVEPTDVEGLVSDVCSIMAGMADKMGVEITASVTPGLPRVRLDDVMTKQILYNLLSNAVKFSTKGSTVALRTEWIENDDSPLAAASLCFTVTDQGRGIGTEDLALLFREFQQIGIRTAGGTGLGLVLVRKLAELQGGRVSVESEFGKGTTFQVWLPVEVRVVP